MSPRLIYVANTGFGQWGPFSKGRASYDGLAQAVSGLTAITGEGEAPTKIGNYLGDWFGASMSAVGALAALRWRDRTGEGQFVEMAQCEGLVRAMDWTWLYAGLTGRDRQKVGNGDHVFTPSGVYRCADGYVAVVAGNDREFHGLCRMLGEPGLLRHERFATAAARRERASARRWTPLAAFCGTRAGNRRLPPGRRASRSRHDGQGSAESETGRGVGGSTRPWHHGGVRPPEARRARADRGRAPVGFHNELVLATGLERWRAIGRTETAAGPPEG